MKRPVGPRSLEILAEVLIAVPQGQVPDEAAGHHGDQKKYRRKPFGAAGNIEDIARNRR